MKNSQKKIKCNSVELEDLKAASIGFEQNQAAANAELKKLEDEKRQLLKDVNSMSTAKDELVEQLQKMIKSNKNLSKKLQELEKNKSEQEKHSTILLANLKKTSNLERTKLNEQHRLLALEFEKVSAEKKSGKRTAAESITKWQGPS